MSAEQRVPAAELSRVTIELDDRDLRVRWAASDAVVINGDEVEAVVEAGELFVGDEGSSEQVALIVPETLPRLTARLRSGGVELSDVHGRVDLRLERGDVVVAGGRGDLAIAIARGDVQVDGLTGKLALDGGSGRKRISGVAGKLAVQSASGDVVVEGGRAATAIAAGSGNVTVRDRDCDRLAIDTGSGDVEVTGGSAESLAVETGSGDIRCTTALGTGTHALTSGSGDLVLGVPRVLSARIEATTARGAIDSTIPLVSIGQRGPKSALGRRLVGSVGDATKRATISLRTGRGTIRLTWLDGAEFPPPAAVAKHDLVDGDAVARSILDALARGAISVEEADRLLRAAGGLETGAL